MFMISHFYEGGTEAQYDAVLKAVHPSTGLPPGQRYHLAGPADGGWLIVATWDSREAFESFVRDTLMPALPTVEGGFAGPPQERAAEVANEVRG